MKFSEENKSYCWKRLLKNSHYDGEHLIWLGSTDNNGYGKFTVDHSDGTRHTCHAHRVSAWIHLGLDIDNPNEHALHNAECGRRNCIEPKHLHIGDHYDNMQDRRKDTHCKYGHAWTPENTYYYSYIGNGMRQCKTCMLNRVKIWREKQKYKKSS